MSLKYAFAVNPDNILVDSHFGDSDKFLIYEHSKNSGLTLKGEEFNIFKSFDEEQEHGSKKKAEAIVGLLKEKGVKVLISKQFGKNIIRMNKHFIPIIVSDNLVSELLESLIPHLNIITDEWTNRTPDFKFFSLKSGIFKKSIKE